MTATRRRVEGASGKEQSRRQSSITTSDTIIHSDALSPIPLDSSLSTSYTHSIHHLDPVHSLLVPTDVNLAASIVIKSYQSAPTCTNRLPLHNTTKNHRPNGLPLFCCAVTT
jgi:hypothetical protein